MKSLDEKITLLLIGDEDAYNDRWESRIEIGLPDTPENRLFVSFAMAKVGRLVKTEKDVQKAVKYLRGYFKLKPALVRIVPTSVAWSLDEGRRIPSCPICGDVLYNLECVRNHLRESHKEGRSLTPEEMRELLY